MTNFEKIKGMDTARAAQYLRDDVCELYISCKTCPFDLGRDDICSAEKFADWLESEAEE